LLAAVVLLTTGTSPYITVHMYPHVLVTIIHPHAAPRQSSRGPTLVGARVNHEPEQEIRTDSPECLRQ
jgi:hypothetical protein